MAFTFGGLRPRYEGMMEAIKKPEFILLFRVFLHNIMESVQKRHLPGVQAIIIPDSKVVTAAYLIALYPRKVMENMNEELTRLALHAAKALVASLERVMRYVVDRVVFRDIPHEATLEFLTTIQEYMVHFRNWQIPDSARIVLRIKTALVALHHARVGAMQNPTSTAGLMAEFARQIERLRGKLVQLRGPAELAAHDLELQGGGL